MQVYVRFKFVDGSVDMLDHHESLPAHWHKRGDCEAKLLTLKINTGLLASALNHKTLGLKSGVGQKIERSNRLVSANASYQEDYDSLLRTGSSSYSDLQLLAGTCLSGNGYISPTDF
jgi:hypothetical protein